MSPVDLLLNNLRYVNRTRVKTDVDSVTQEYRTLIPRIVDFVHDNGSQSKMIVLSGTIPIMYQSVQYNIPVDLFVTTSYPSEAPKLYVRPTSNMTVKANHQHVSPNGLCYLPYLHEWTAPCTLVGLVEIASSVFSIEPPLFSRPAGVSATPPPVAQRPFASTATTSSNPFYTNPNQQATASPVTASVSVAVAEPAYGSYATAAAISAGTATAAPTVTMASAQRVATATTASPPAGGTNPFSTSTTNTTTNTNSSSSSGKGSAIEEERRRLELVDAVTMRMYEVIDNKQRTLRDELDQQMATSSALSQSADAAAKTLKDLKSSVAMYTEAVNAITEKTAAFDAWNADAAAKPVLHAADRLVPYDPLSQQIVRLNSEIHAIDDAFYYMERALVSSRNDKVDLGTFLKECRQLSRKQFLCKAHLRKITAECLQQSAQRTAEQYRNAPIPEQQQQYQQQPPMHHQHQLQHHQYGQQQAQNGQVYANAAPVQQGYAAGNSNLNSMNSGISAVPYPGAVATAGRY